MSLGQKEFNTAMQLLAPFEAEPVIAVAVSGGIDSMALLHLSHAWAKTNSGRVVVMTVDHGLRKEAAQECKQVKIWAHALGIDCHILKWQGDKPQTGIQNAARRARYQLLTSCCRDLGILHLLLAHTLNDQAETFAIRQENSSGPDGLAAMSTIVSFRDCRILRPLLTIDKKRLRFFLKSIDQSWTEDPSNTDQRYQRVRVREKITPNRDALQSFGDQCQKFRTARLQHEKTTAIFAAMAVSIMPLGFAKIDRDKLRDADKTIAIRVLSQLIRCVGGLDYSPNRNAVDKLWQGLVGGVNDKQTLGRCQIEGAENSIFIGRENRNLPKLQALNSKHKRWDNRFLLSIIDSGQNPNDVKETNFHIGPLKDGGKDEFIDDLWGRLKRTVPLAHFKSLPVVRLGKTIVSIAGYENPQKFKPLLTLKSECVFSPPVPFMEISG